MADEVEVKPIIQAPEVNAAGKNTQGKSLADRLFGPVLAKFRKQPAATPIAETTVPADTRPEWLQKEQARMEPIAAQTAFNQTTETGFPQEGFTTAPSVEGTGMSPFDAAARQGTLPAKEIDSQEIQEAKAAGGAATQQTEDANRLEQLRSSLSMETKTPK